MRQGQYFLILLLSVICFVLTAGLIVMGQTNMRMQVRLQNQQQKLNQGILGQQAQQISGGVLKDMADVATRNREMRRLLEKHGFQIQPDAAPAAGSAAKPESKSTEGAVEEGVKQ